MITFTASATDPEGRIAGVEFLSNQSRLPLVATAPFTYSWVQITVGVAPNVKIVAIKILGNKGSGSGLNIARGIVHAADIATVRVISMSLGGSGLIKRAMKEAIDYAVNKGKLVIVAAGNDDDDASYFNPAHYERCFAVGATNSDDTRSSFSNYGPAIDISAPGKDIYSCFSGSTSEYKSLSGTSMATPFVSGLASGGHTLWVRGKDSAGFWQGEDVATMFTWTIDLVAPTVVPVNSTKADGRYANGEQIDITVRFNKMVRVVTTGGTQFCLEFIGIAEHDSLCRWKNGNRTWLI
ncbi:MAG: S8 family serine peptidase [Candidatus Ozemobacteraceae bacterium]